MYFSFKHCMNFNWQHEFHAVGFCTMLCTVGKVHSQKHKELNPEEMNTI